MERQHETKKRQSLSGVDETPRKIPRCSGNSKITYLREKTEKDFDFRERELVFKEKDLELDKKRKELNEAQLKHMARQSQEQTEALMSLWTYIYSVNCFVFENCCLQ